MRKRAKVVVVGGASAILVAGVMASYSYTDLKEITRNYIDSQGQESSLKVLKGYRLLGAVGIRGMPGFAGALGKVEARSYASQLRHEEQAAYDRLRSHVLFFALSQEIKDCTWKLNQWKLDEIDGLLSLTGGGFIQTAAMDEELAKVGSKSNQLCRSMYLKAYGPDVPSFSAPQAAPAPLAAPAPAPQAAPAPAPQAAPAPSDRELGDARAAGARQHLMTAN